MAEANKPTHPSEAVDQQEPLPSDAGMSTAEYAVGTVAACGFAAVLWGVVHSSAVSSLLQSVVERALTLARRLSRTPHIFPVLSGAWVFHIVRGQIERSRELGQEFLELADREGVAALSGAGLNASARELRRVRHLHVPHES